MTTDREDIMKTAVLGLHRTVPCSCNYCTGTTVLQYWVPTVPVCGPDLPRVTSKSPPKPTVRTVYSDCSLRVPAP